MLELWVSKAMAENLLITGEVLHQKWSKFADLAGVPKDEHLILSDGWLSRFKTRNGLKQFKRHGEAGSADPEVIRTERSRLQKLMEELIQEHGYTLKDIFNMDETGLFYGTHHLSFSAHFSSRMPPNRGLADKQSPGVKGKKVRLTYAFTSNADGSETLLPFIIGKAKRP
jgi:hypothetical protein